MFRIKVRSRSIFHIPVKVNFIDINDGQALLFGCVQLVEQVDAALNKVSARRFRHTLLLPDFLSLDSILEIESPQTRHSNALVSESAVEQYGSLLKRETSPLLKSFRVQEEIKVLLVKEARSLLEIESFGRIERFGADILHFIGSELQSACNDSVREIFGGFARGSEIFEAQKESSLLKLRLEVF